MIRIKIGRNSVYVFLGVLVLLSTSLCQAEPDTRLSDSLRDSLKRQGWQEYQASDGSVIYRQPVIRAASDELSPSNDQHREQVGEALQDRGWHATWGDDGSLILKPRVAPTTYATSGDAQASDTQTAIMSDPPGFEFWRIEKDEDGSVRFYPLEQLPKAEAIGADRTAVARCEGHQIVTASVILPVDEWYEIYDLAEAWINSVGLQGVQVGRVRKIFRVYLVSLVRNTPPYTLTHQLAVRASDGRVMWLD
ncbi:MAG: hypothetical protein KZQ80_17625 [Candidatus Thiodiazotropha sp. (ex Monitilora ramsayi)]|nr:hypothetical protein [Candidatus Thiodiazotropha sp. (ex Monitilora ramsayi)]